MKVEYEWATEEVDSEGDIINISFYDNINYISAEDFITNNTVLVRDETDARGFIGERLWAYVKDGKLPEFFYDAMGEVTRVKVPKYLHKSFNEYINK